MTELRMHRILVPNLMAGQGKHALAVYDWGDANATSTVVCVHGLTRNARDFDAIARTLAARGKRVFALSMAGRGESEWLTNPIDYNYVSYAADCLAVLDNFHIRNVDWIGTSMGGIIGMMLAAQHPDRIRKLVLNDVGMKLPKEALARIYEYVQTMPRRFETREAADAYLRKTFAPFNITNPDHWQVFVEYSLLPHAEGGVKLACDPNILEPLRAVTQEFTDVADVSLTELWEKIRQPTFILRGALSDILSEETVRAMKATHPRAESVVIEGVGHAPSLMEEHHIRTVLNWLIPQGIGL